MAPVDAGTIQNESDFPGPAIFPRFDAQQKLGIDEPLAVLVQQHGIYSVAKTKAHAGGNENIFEAVGIQVADADAPGPQRLGSDLPGDLLKTALSAISVKGIAENIVGGALQIGVAIFGRAPGFTFLLLEGGAEI